MVLQEPFQQGRKTFTAEADDPLAAVRQLKPFQCGQEALSHFGFDAGYTNLNHGSYGATPQEVMDVHHYYRQRAESRPDTFIRYQYRTRLLDEARTIVEDYLKVPRDTCVLVQNATIAFDTVMRNLVFKAGDVIVCFATMYDSFFNTVQYLSETTPVRIARADYTLPVSDKHICDSFEATIKHARSQGQNPRIAVFDTVNSLPGVRMPFERLTEICRANRVLSCIDGAHGIGQFPLHLEALDPDFFMSNCHKWLHVPRPCGFLYVPKRHQHLLRATIPTGFNFVPRPGTPNFVKNFASLSTLDDTPYVCIEAALQWRSKVMWNERIGEEAIMDYTQDLAIKGGQLVARALGTEIMDNEEHTLTDCSMVNVRLPLDIEATHGVNSADNVASAIMQSMILEAEIAVNVFVYADVLWVRLSAQIYLTLEDFERAARQLAAACQKYRVRKHDSKDTTT